MMNLIPDYISLMHQNKRYAGQFEAAAVFVDISGFTSLTEALSEYGREGSEVLSRLINEVFTPCINSVYNMGGFISHFAGDSFLAIFKGNLHAALISSQQIIKLFSRKGIKRTKFGTFRISAKIGVSYGNVEWGIIGNDHKKTYYFKGEAVNGCSRSEKQCRLLDIVLDRRAYKIIKPQVKARWIAKGFYRIMDINCRKIKSEPETPVPDLDLSAFYSCNKLSKSRVLDELRETASIFISFREADSSHKGLNEFVSNIIAITDKFGGYFNRVSFGDKGGTILINFGIPVLFEKSIQRAADCIYEIWSYYGGIIRAGITFGTLFSGFIGCSRMSAYDVLGNSVNLSARMAMAAPWGEIWVSEDVSSLVQGYLRLVLVGSILFKGRSERDNVYRIEGKRKSPENIYTGRIFGRKSEIKQIKMFLKPIFSNRFAGVACIYGDPGIGKSRLLYEIKSNYEPIAHTCILACDSILRKPWNPLISYLRGYFEQDPAVDVSLREYSFRGKYKDLTGRLMRSGNAAASNIKKELERTEPFIRALLSLDPKDTVYNQLRAKQKHQNTLCSLKEFFKAQSILMPTILLFEDIHWIDHESNNFIRYLTSNLADFPIAIICSSRFNDDGSKPAVHSDEAARHKEIVLARVDDSSAESIMAESLGYAADTALSGIIKDKTANNPFFMEQFCLYLQENGLIFLKGNKYYSREGSMAIPSQVNQILISRIDRLPGELRELVKIASIFGREFNKDILFSVIKMLYKLLKSGKNRVSRNFDTEALRNLSMAGSSCFILQGENENIWNMLHEFRYAFRHSLMNETAYELQLRERLRLLHQTAGMVIESRAVSSGSEGKDYYSDLSYHFEKACNIEKAREYIQKAGEFFLETYKNSQAEEMFKKLSDYVTDKKMTVKIKHRLGIIHQLLGKWPEAEKELEQSIEISRKVDDRLYLANSFRLAGGIKLAKGDIRKALDYFNSAMNIFREKGDRRGMAIINGFIGNYHLLREEYSKALKNYQQQMRLFRELNDKRSLALITGNIGLVFKNQGKYDRAMKYYMKSRKISENIGDKEAYRNAVGNIGNLFYKQGRFDKALELLCQDREISKAIGDKSGYAVAIGNIGNIYMSLGEFDRAIEHYQESLEVSLEVGNRREAGLFYKSLAEAYYNRKNYGTAIEYYDMSYKILSGLGMKLTLLDILFYKTEALIAGNDIKNAERANRLAFKLCTEQNEIYYRYFINIQKLMLISYKNKKAAIDGLLELIPSAETEEQKAKALLELYRLEKKEAYKARAVSAYKSLFDKYRDYQYKAIYEELQKNY